MRKLLILLLVTGCGFFTPKTKTQILANPVAKKSIEIGDTWRYVYDSSRSSKAILDAAVTLMVTEIDEYAIFVQVDGYAKTALGTLPIRSRQEIPRSILTLQTLADLRSQIRLILPNVVLEWVGLTAEGCDKIKAYSIKGADSVEVIGKLCAQSATLPELEATVADLGLRITFVSVL